MNAVQDIEGWDALLNRVREKRRRIAAFNDKFGPRGALLTNVSIVSSAIATLLTAGPAIGGFRLTQALGQVSDNSPSWRVLCAGAALCSLIATIATNLFRTHDIASRLARAQACDAKLEALEIMVELKQLTLKEATSRFEKYIPDVSFIPSGLAQLGRFTRARPLDGVEAMIHAPHRNDHVDTTFVCSGCATGLQPGLHLWLAVEVEGRLWPKESEVSVKEDGSWSKTIFEEGQAGEFSLSLWATNGSGDRYIRNWLEQSDRSGNYHELRRTQGMRRLARVNGLHRELEPQGEAV
ncbi:hypothetical protein HSX11_12160 [Oxalobacteraceae bacterium]|nr:hypothetical protein [Oxalobacteraceae bacterium]